MARPSRTGGKTSEAKARNASAAKGLKTTKTEPRIAPAPTRRLASDPSKDLKEAREQQAATAEILKVIASSPSDVQPVFDAIVANANRLIGGFSTGVYRFVGGICHLEAFTPVNPAADEMLKSWFPRPVASMWPFERAHAGETVEITDTETDPAEPLREITRARGVRSLLCSPLMSKGTAIGVILVSRRNPGSFSAHHVELLQAFADQAVIAIENARLFNETQEALERQTATADILKVIASSPSDVQPVFEAIVGSAARLIGAFSAGVYRFVDGVVHLAAITSTTPAGDEALRTRFPRPIEDTSFTMAQAGEVSQVADTETDERSPLREIARRRGFRSIVWVPLRSSGVSIGAIAVSRKEPGPFAADHIDLLQTFADQAVIAIENVRLFNETKEALERQTATADILKVIASSATDAQPVFDAIVESTQRLLGGFSAAVFRFIDGIAYLEAITPTNPAADEIMKNSFPRPVADFQSFAIVQGGKIAQVPDTDALSDDIRDIARGRGFRSMLLAPLMSGGTPIGLVSVTRVQTGTFAAHHEQLLQTFADQAVIAIENVRLFDEVQAKTHDLTEALVYQTGSEHVLRVIASSPTNVEPVLNAIVERTCELCEAYDAVLRLRVGDEMVYGAHHGTVPKTINALPLSASWTAGRSLLEKRAVHVHDLLSAEGDEFPGAQELARHHGHRTVLSVPLLRENEGIGAITLRRLEVNPFSDKQIKLLQTFADQAVIAIGNVRLFEEVQSKTHDLTEALQQQTATAEVLKVISRSAFDLQKVLDALLASACRLCEADMGTIRYLDGNAFRLATTFGCKPEWIDHFSSYSATPDRSSIFGRTIIEGHTVHVPDVLADPDFNRPDAQKLMGFRAAIGVPLVREGLTFGVVNLFRFAAGSFGEKQIELVQTFADQAVIAIENVRLFDEVQARTEDLSESLQQQTATADVLKVISRSAFDLHAVFETLAESSVRLCGADRAFIYRFDGELLRMAAAFNCSPAFTEWVEQHPIRPGRHSGCARAALERRTIHIPDVLADPDYTYGAKDVESIRTVLGVPILKGDDLLGVIMIYHLEIRPFTDKQIALVETFADQAAIAIENARLFDEVQAKTRDLSEALTFQTGSSNILSVIASSPTDVGPVLQAIVESACELCEAYDAIIALKDGNELALRAHHGPIAMNRERWPNHRTSLSGRAIADRAPVHLRDVLSDEGAEFPIGQEMSRLDGVRSMLSVPMIRDGEAIGTIVLRRIEVNPFSNRQVALLQTFADQAVIAIGNVRLFEEVQARTRDLTESLEQQTATADVLQIISSSPGDLAPVFEKLLENATRVCGANFGTMNLVEDGVITRVAAYNVPSAYADASDTKSFRPHPKSSLGHVIATKAPHHFLDLLTSPAYLEGNPAVISMVHDAGARSLVTVPMIRDTELIGTISVYDLEARPFTGKQIELLSNFAKQAVIAIENARLLKELRESLQQQTATADVLKIISRSSVDLETVLDTLVQTVARLCRADQATMFRRLGDKYHLVASRGFSAEGKEFVLTHPLTDDRGTLSGRVAAARRAVHIPDVLQDPEYTYREGQTVLGYRTMLGIPLLREQTLIGIFSIHRTRVEPFTGKEIELASSFADQAVIAIENARLFEELHDRQAELRVTFDNMGDGVVMFDNEARLTAWNRNFQEMLDLPDAFLAGRPSWAEFFRYLADRGEYSTDLEAQLSRTIEDTSREMRFERVRPDGRVIEVRRNPVPGGGFVLIYSDITERKHAEEAIRTARDAAEAALRDLQTAQDRLIQTEKLASLGQLTAGIAHEIKNPLNFVNNFSALSAELADELNEVLKPVVLDRKVRGEVDELTGMLKDNLEKVVQHGKRADSIVKNMLLHSREGSGEQRPTDINALVDESLNLAYHGARAERPGFNITMQRDFDPAAGMVNIFGQEITRVLLNLISNGFYAATKRTAETGHGFEPTLRVTTKNLGEKVEIRIRDNGIGIATDVKGKMFNPFFTTKPAGEGTGLGLSMSHDIVVKQHRGTIEVDTEPGVFAEFIVTLPRIMAP